MVAICQENYAYPDARMASLGGLSKGELLSRLDAADVRLNEAAQALFADARFVTSGVSSAVAAIQVSVGALGFPVGATFSDLVGRARSQGLRLCPLELGPHLRLQFTDQAEGAAGNDVTRGCASPGSLTVASKPVSNDDETPKGFYMDAVNQAPQIDIQQAPPVIQSGFPYRQGAADAGVIKQIVDTAKAFYSNIDQARNIICFGDVCELPASFLWFLAVSKLQVASRFERDFVESCD